MNINKFAILIAAVLTTALVPQQASAQTYETWRGEATSGNWQVSGNWWNFQANGGAGGADTFVFAQQQWNNNHYTSQTNNNGGSESSTWQWVFQSGANSAHTFSGDAVRFYDNSGTDPMIQNESSATHVINNNISGDGDSADPFSININGAGGLSFGGSVNNQGANINVGGTTGSAATVTFQGDVTGSGGMYVNNGNLTVLFDGTSSQTGQLTINAGTVRLGGSGDTFGGSSQAIRIGTGATLDLNNVSTTVGSIGEEGSSDGGSVSLGSATLTVGGNSYATFQNGITGSGALVKSGSGTLNLYGTVSYTGSTTVNGGVLSSAVAMSTEGVTVSSGTFGTTAANVLGNSVGVTVNGGVYRVGGSDTIGVLSGSGGEVAITNGTLTTSFDGVSNNFAGVITGAGGFAKAGTGTLSLSGSSNNTIAGNFAVNAGTVVLNKTAGVDAVAGNITVASSAVLTNAAANQINDNDGVTISSGGTWALGGNNETVAALDVDGSLALGTAQLIVNGTSSSWAGTVSGASGSSIVFKADTTDIQGNNTGLASGSALYVVGGVVGLNHNNAAGSSTVYLGETFGANNATLDSSVSGTTIGNNIVVRTGSSGTRTIDNATGTGSRAITFNGGVDLQDTVFVNSSASENVTFGGVISNSGSIVKQGAGTMTLGAVNTMSGGVYVDDGTLVVASGADLTAAANVTIGTANFSSDAVLSLASGAAGLDRTINVASGAGTRAISSAGDNTVNGGISQSGNLTVSNTTGTLTLGSVTMNTSGNNDLAVAGAGNVSIGGAITAGSGASSVDKSGAGTLTISGDNSGQSYMLNINGGKVVLDNANALGTGYGDKVNFTGTSTLTVAADISSASLGLRVADGIEGTIQVNSGNNLSAATLGAVSGAGTFRKTGTGTLTLTGTSTAANTNKIYGGTLFVSSGAALAGTTEVIGATLAGSGSVGATTVATSGTISPGNSPGTLSLTNGLTWSGGGNYNWQIYNTDDSLAAGLSNTWDLIAVSGGDFDISGLNSGTKFSINLWSLSAVSPDANGAAINWDNTQNQLWEIVTFTSLNGTFSQDMFNLNTGAINGTGGFANNLNGGVFSLAVDGDSLNLLFTASNPTPSAVPEPGTWAAAAMLASAAGYVRWRRRKQVEPKA